MILLIVLMIVGSLTVAVTDTAKETFFLEQYSEKVLTTEQIMAVADSISQGVKELFRYDDKNVDYYGEYWSYPVPISLDGIDVVVEIRDEERFLNPNSLINGGTVDEKMEKIFNRLFEITGIGSDITDAIIKWIKPVKEADDNLKHAFLNTNEEMLLIPGISGEIYNGTVEMGSFKPGLRSLLSVWSSGKVNINTTSKWILMALDDEISESIAAEIISYRKKHPFKKVDDLINVNGITSDIIYRIKPFTDVKSSHFLVKATVTIGDVERTLTFLFKRSGNSVTEVWRKIQ